MSTDLAAWLGVAAPVIQAPMAGAQDEALAVAVARAGGLGSLPFAMLSLDAMRAQLAAFRAGSGGAPVNVNFFCHTPPTPNPAVDAAWAARLQVYFDELGAKPGPAGPTRAPFDEARCAIVEELRPEVVSFHFGLPAKPLLDRVRAAGAKVLGCATTVAEARHLEAAGCDAVIAQGAEAGGHRGTFLPRAVEAEIGTFALVPLIVDAVRVPVIAAGGVGDARGVAAAFALGAAAVQVGTAYLRCPEARISGPHRAALEAVGDAATRITNVMSGKPARGIENRLMRELGPMNASAPAFPAASAAIAPLRAAAEAKGAGDFSPLWAGQAAALARSVGAEELTRALAAAAPIR